MKMWGYYAFHTALNSIKRLFCSKIVLVILIVSVACGLLGAGIGFAVSIFTSEYIQEQEETMDSQEEEVPPEEEVLEEEMTEEDLEMIRTVIYAIVIALCLGGVLFGMYSGTKKGADIFLMADVNFLFPSPMKPQSVMLFRLTFGMFSLVLASMYLLFQMPNLVINLGLSIGAVLMILAAWIMFLSINQLVSVLTYTIVATYPKLVNKVFPFIISVVVFLGAIIYMVFLSNEKDLPQTLMMTVANPMLKYVPLIGWTGGLVFYALKQQFLMSILYLIWDVLGVVGLIYLTWRVKADFYEDALESANKREELTVNAAEGRNVEVSEKAGQKRQKRLERKNEFHIRGTGAFVFFYKELDNRKRFARFGFFTKTAITYLGISVVVATGLVKFLEVREFTVIGLILAVIVFFRSSGNPIEQETSHIWLFLAPDQAYRKIFCSLMAGTVNASLDLLPALIVANLILQSNPVYTFLWFLLLLSLDFMFGAFGLMLDTWFKKTDVIVSAMLGIFIRMIMCVISIVLIAGCSLFMDLGFAMLITICYQLLVGFVSFSIYPNYFHEGLE